MKDKLKSKKTSKKTPHQKRHFIKDKSVKKFLLHHLQSVVPENSQIKLPCFLDSLHEERTDRQAILESLHEIRNRDNQRRPSSNESLAHSLSFPTFFFNSLINEDNQEQITQHSDVNFFSNLFDKQEDKEKN